MVFWVTIEGVFTMPNEEKAAKKFMREAKKSGMQVKIERLGRRLYIRLIEQAYESPMEKVKVKIERRSEW